METLLLAFGAMAVLIVEGIRYARIRKIYEECEHFSNCLRANYQQKLNQRNAEVKRWREMAEEQSQQIESLETKLAESGSHNEDLFAEFEQERLKVQTLKASYDSLSESVRKAKTLLGG